MTKPCTWLIRPSKSLLEVACLGAGLIKVPLCTIKGIQTSHQLVSQALKHGNIAQGTTELLLVGCSRFIYLCDDGRDPEKAQYMHSKGPGYIYVAGRVRQPGEMNGKSGNLNNVLMQLYGDLPIPGNEILCILDADMVSDRISRPPKFCKQELCAKIGEAESISPLLACLQGRILLACLSHFWVLDSRRAW